ncbi:MAG TPA: hypothetical protein VD970_14045 [Acetobacteraceae bacterium]|nr:hypothetical protein [Acetobacteraceae bacterium]
MGLLDDLKKQADALKANEVDKTESLRAAAVAVDHSLRRSFLYLNDLGKQLNVVQMPSTFKFSLPTVGDIEGLIIKDFFCDFRSKHFIDKDYYGEVHVAYRCWSDKVLTVKKGPDEMEKFRNVLWQNNIEHTSEQFRDARKVITHEVFKVKCDFRVQAKFEGNHETARLKISSKNVGGFDVAIFNLTAQEMNDRAIEEFAKYFIGRPNEWVELTKRSSLAPKVAAPAPRQPRPEPQYLNQKPGAAPAANAQKPGTAPGKAPQGQEPPEEKKSVLGSIASVLKKDIF